jgi:hypothetical protein
VDSNDRIEGAKRIVEFMPDWEWELSEGHIYKVTRIDDSTHHGSSDLWTDHNLLHEVLGEIGERHDKLFELYMENFRSIIKEKYGPDHFNMQKKAHLADPETKFQAIVRTLEGEVE